MRVLTEINPIRKNLRKVSLKIALCYPNTYRIGMAHYGLQLLYFLFNSFEHIACERVFFTHNSGGIRSLESNLPLSDFDVIAFTLQFEAEYINALKILHRSGIPLRRTRRKRRPIVIAGGPCVTQNPFPLLEFFDAFFIGEIEPVIEPLVEGLIRARQKGDITYLENIDGVLVADSPANVKRVWVRNLDEGFHPTSQIVPVKVPGDNYMPVFGRAFYVEISRGCEKGCRFCLESSITRPRRDRTYKKITEIIADGLHSTPADKVVIIGASASNHRNITEICEYIISLNKQFSVPSMRVQDVNSDVISLLKKGGQRTVTLAPETGNYPLRCRIRKDIRDEDILDAARIIRQYGLKLKLYFMIGLPGERKSDIESIAKLIKQIAKLGFPTKSIHISINQFIPKPHTPFQWMPLADVSYIHEAVKTLNKTLSDVRGIIDLDLPQPQMAKLLAMLSLGDSKLANVLEYTARHNGLAAWKKALKEFRVDEKSYLSAKDLEQKFVWDIIDIGIDKKFLIEEYYRATRW